MQLRRLHGLAVCFSCSFLLLPVLTSSTLFVNETFSDEDWASRWRPSGWERATGRWAVSAGRFGGDSHFSKGLQTTEDFKTYAVSSALPHELRLEGSETELVFQFSVRHEQRLMPSCGGGYLKILPVGHNINSFTNESPYLVSFGPDICGTATRDVVLQVRAASGAYYKLKEKVRCETDQATHLYTLLLFRDNEQAQWDRWEIQIDEVRRASGSFRLNNNDEWTLTGGSQTSDASFDLGFGSVGGFLGWEVWQDKGGSIFDNILISTDRQEAQTFWQQQHPDTAREKEGQLVGAFLEAEESQHRATTRRIQEMRAKQDSGLSLKDAAAEAAVGGSGAKTGHTEL